MDSTPETILSSSVIRRAARSLNVSADNLSITRLAGDASTRSYYRAQADDASVVIAIYSEPFDEAERASERLRRLEAVNPSMRLTFASDPCAHIEVTSLLLEAKLPVPRIIDTAGTDALILIEDVGDTRLQDWLGNRSAEEVSAAITRALELIIKIQETTAEAIRNGTICSRLAFDEMKLKWELGFFFANYVNRYLGLKLDAALAIGIQEDFKSLCSELSARPRVLVHRDYHTRNLMMRDGELFIIDHQDARMGPGSYDVASLLSDPYTAFDSAIVEEMTERFIEMKAASTVLLGDVDEFRTELELMTLQRMLKAIGTYAYQAAAMKNPVYTPYIEPAIHSALASMRSLGRFASIRALLERARQG